MHKTALLLLTFLFCGAAFAQAPLTIEFESGQGERLAALLDSATVSLRDRLDVNGDGARDLVAIREDNQGTPEAIVAFDLASGEELGAVPFQDITNALGTDDFSLVGFLDLNANDSQEAIFRSRDALAVFADFSGGSAIPKDSVDPFLLPAERTAVFDIDGDGVVELIIQNPETQTVQIWGNGATGTATEDEIEAALFRLFQNYPNPFQASTTITYEVEQAGPVNVTVYDLLGRRVRTLVDVVQTAGTHRARWDGRDASGQPVASGSYFYRLRVGDAVSSKQALRIR